MNSRRRKAKNTQKFPKGSADHKAERRKYLGHLVHEFNNTNSKDAKLQVLANLANFSYDPYNYQFFRDLNVIEIFLYQIEFGKIDKLVEYAMGGLCNCAFDDNLSQQILQGRGVELIMLKLSESKSISMITSSLTALMSLITPTTRHNIVTADLEAQLSTLVQHKDKRVQNLANVFLEDYFPNVPPAKRRKID